jgi:methyltransferase
MLSLALYELFLAGVVAERSAELVVSKRHARWAIARGGVESGRGHYPAMVALHTALIAGAALEPLLFGRRFRPRLGWPMLGLALGAQALRWWCVATLGQRWNTRVITIPGLPRIRSGPYRALSHPNYLAVVVEGLALPLVHSAWLTAGAFTLLNAPLLAVRIRSENAALKRAEGATP